MSAYPSYTRIFVLPQPAVSVAAAFAPAANVRAPAALLSEEPMPTWLQKKTLGVDLAVAASMTLGLWGWFGAVLHNSGMLAVFLGFTGLFQMLRFVNAQIGELQWARMHEALLRDKAQPGIPPPARGDGYREAAAVDEPPADDVLRLETEVPRRRRRAMLSLGVAGASVWLLTLVPGLLFGTCQVAVAATFVAAVTALFFWTMRAVRAKQRDMSRDDYFIQHLDRDTKALLEPKPRVRVETENAHLRVGVDFGVPAEQLEPDDAGAEPTRSAAPERGERR